MFCSGNRLTYPKSFWLSRVKSHAILGMIMLFIIITCMSSDVLGQNQTPLPRWLTSINKLWSQNQISDQEFVNVYKYLIDKKILVIYDINQTHNLTFEKQLELTKQIASYVDINIKNSASLESKSSKTNPELIKTRLIYIEPPPSYYIYSENMITNATDYWLKYDNVKFNSVSSPSDLVITVKWIKETDLPESGYTIGNKIIEIGLGDTKCGVWKPYDQSFISNVLRHELGHALGHMHSTNPSDVMYPIISGKQYLSTTDTEKIQQTC